jgi:phosphoglycolate phosphatase
MDWQAVLFDLDGTLLDTLEDLADATNAVLAREAMPTHPVHKYRYFVGDGLRNQLLRALPPGSRDEETLARCMKAAREEYAHRWDRKTRPYDGVPEMLHGLTGRGVRRSILSNKPDDFARLVVERLLSEWSFEVVLGAREGVPLKPDPTGALEVAREMAVPPEDFLYVGDTATDMRTARAAGMFPVGALWGFRTAHELRESGAKELLDRPGQLLDLL